MGKFTVYKDGHDLMVTKDHEVVANLTIKEHHYLARPLLVGNDITELIKAIEAIPEEN